MTAQQAVTFHDTGHIGKEHSINMSNSRFSRSQRRAAIIMGVIAVLVVGGLLLPPISVLERTGLVCSGTTLNADSPAVTTLTGLTVALSDASRPLTFKSESVDQAAYETAQAGEALVDAQAAQPMHLVLRSPIHQLDACGQEPVSASIAVALPDEQEAWPTTLFRGKMARSDCSPVSLNLEQDEPVSHDPIPG
ncbi:MAG: hypothetical protein HGB05_10040, partial [Chloroflexi bacterium]|nr:hypothetical protein [Chloroflexota bacterium]